MKPLCRSLLPPKLRRGDTVRVVAPSRSRAMVAEHDHSALIDQRFAGLGLRLTDGAHVDERDDFDSSRSRRGWPTCTPRSQTRTSPPC